ncbi:MAG: mannosyl-3-phosphoglycerate phosphatase [Halioglobus sp.]|jgi:mannosyl-3-phosphoglycerate phosphatase
MSMPSRSTSNLPSNRCFLVFSDLDGSLLDHRTYSYQDALPQLRMLQRLGIPVIPATSKTRVEIEFLRAQLGNTGPFIAENGAAVYIPKGYFECQPADTVERGGYWVHELAASRDKWLNLLSELLEQFPQEYDYFYQAGTAGIMQMTNLTRARAMAANQREYSEPVKWRGDDDRKAEFIACLQSRGACVQSGGRFLAISGECDKGKALAWLRQIYQKSKTDRLWHDLAIGDSDNDRTMLEVAETALLVRSPVHDYPQLSRSDGVLISKDFGPTGWGEGVARWLQHHQIGHKTGL